MNEINFYNLNKHRKNIYSIFHLTTQARSFSTSTKNNINNNESNLDNLNSKSDSKTNNSFIDFVDLDHTPAGISSNKQSLKKFKKVFGGGYLGYKNVHHFGSVFFDPRDKVSYTIENLENKLIEYLMIYLIL